MAEVLAEYGPAVVKGAMRRMIRDASRAIGERLLRIPDGEWEERIYMAGLGAEDRSAHRFVTRLRKTGDQLVFSNEGTDPQLGSASSVYGTWRSGVDRRAEQLPRLGPAAVQRRRARPHLARADAPGR